MKLSPKTILVVCSLFVLSSACLRGQSVELDPDSAPPNMGATEETGNNSEPVSSLESLQQARERVTNAERELVNAHVELAELRRLQGGPHQVETLPPPMMVPNVEPAAEPIFQIPPPALVNTSAPTDADVMQAPDPPQQQVLNSETLIADEATPSQAQPAGYFFVEDPDAEYTVADAQSGPRPLQNRITSNPSRRKVLASTSLTFNTVDANSALTKDTVDADAAVQYNSQPSGDFLITDPIAELRSEQ